jgi:hypothetical protein
LENTKPLVIRELASKRRPDIEIVLPTLNQLVAEHPAPADDQNSHKGKLYNQESKNKFTVERQYLKEPNPDLTVRLRRFL